VDPVGSGKGPMTGSYEYGDEPLGSGATHLIVKFTLGNILLFEIRNWYGQRN
jgi:hypothetical protein